MNSNFKSIIQFCCKCSISTIITMHAFNHCKYVLILKNRKSLFNNVYMQSDNSESYIIAHCACNFKQVGWIIYIAKGHGKHGNMPKTINEIYTTSQQQVCSNVDHKVAAIFEAILQQNCSQVSNRISVFGKSNCKLAANFMCMLKR